jgi:hypothetical protein
VTLAGLIGQIRWRPGIGDPSVLGWLTVTAYAAAALLCFVAAQGRRGSGNDDQDGRPRRLWRGVGLVMAVLCLNKQLDLQSLFTDIGRTLATRWGWYDERRTIQLLFVIAAAAAGTAMVIYIASKTRSILRERKLLLFGLAFLLTFIVIRAASFHHVATVLAAEVLGVRVNGILELTGILMIALSAARSIFRPRSRSAA